MPAVRDRDGKKKNKYRSDGTPIWERRAIDGPGIWVSCVKGKERQAIGELYDVFESVAEDLWPSEADESGEGAKGGEHEEEKDEELSIEAQMEKEMAVIKQPRAQKRFANCATNTNCVLFISCKKPVDPVKLVKTYVENVHNTGVSRTRHVHRLVPTSASCTASPAEVRVLCRKVLTPFFAREDLQGRKYKIELRIRNHTTYTRQQYLDEIVANVPEGFTVDLTDPNIFVLVEVFKSVCGVSVVEDYYRYQKFNVMELANAQNSVEETK